MLTRRARSALLSVVLVCALAAPASAAHAAARITGASHAPLVAAAGDHITLTAKVKGAGKPVAIGLILGDTDGSSTGGIQLGPGTRSAKPRVKVPGTVPATVAPGEDHTLLVCIDPATNPQCFTAARITTSGPSTEERLAAAQQSGRLSKSRAIVLGLQALRTTKGVPPELQGDAVGPGGEQAAIKAAASSFATLPAAAQKATLPYFVPPRQPNSAWSVPGRNSKLKAHTAAADCTGYDSLQFGSGAKGPGQDSYPWAGVPTSDGHTVVWYGTVQDPKLKQAEAEDRASARAYAAAMPLIWSTLTKEFGQPLSDAKAPCYHGPDGRLDIYVDDGLVGVNGGRHSLSTLAITLPYSASGQFCTHRPAFILARRGLSSWAIAHEFMHVLQFAHRYASCAEPISWWDEGGANWAADFVYPDVNTQHDAPALVADPLSADLPHLDYDAWPFWMMLQRTQGTGVLRAIFTQLASKRSVQAVDAAVPGGLATQIPRFFATVLNQSPVGDAGFAIPESFHTWDAWDQTPAIPDGQTMSVGSPPIILSAQRKTFPPLSVGAYHRIAVPDPGVRQITFTNGLVGKPGAHVDALMHMADGTWKLADWTAKDTVTLCRDRADENVNDLIVISTNAGTTPLPAFSHTVTVSPTCPFPKQFTGTWTRVYTEADRGTFTETITGTATYVRNPLFPVELDATSQILYDVQSASVKWTVTGSDGGAGCKTTFSGQGTDTPTIDHTGTNTDLGLENVTGKPGVPSPEPSPVYYSIRAGIDPSTAPMFDITDCHGNHSQESIIEPYLAIGHPGPIDAGTPQSEVQKTGDPRTLAGHHAGFDAPDVIGIDDTWAFAGSD